MIDQPLKEKSKQLSEYAWDTVGEHLNVGEEVEASIIHKFEKGFILLLPNDFEGLFGLENCISEIKFILCPAKVHLAHEPINNKLLWAVKQLKTMGIYFFNAKDKDKNINIFTG